ncbi:MarR family winged helix-turn-helix transcriptional regulator [Bordetella avium]|uniref:MarR-family transcriptional regulator n=1 Tax=Bordetella avium (strain 197N) TaxID=360910 RepID=Q2KXE9_BORA1|nr:MarR family transcriptional regulator [Bordetella avium]AZY49859.1 MarR family transcriptional regulator [Bordetella avium]AZY53198.1 MarR family transcriptional regulator [Bordetella avium]RIQ12455.1 MarR family transcriptional regulator [Bordetella avium]RIQ17547.1 MarR family transcriptional regulator [Bordetella avium]RIQ32205.1 MarR family transcriptional regulator [Bordetella avium]
MKDHVDFVLSQWADERPDLDVSPMAVCARLFRVNVLATRNAERAFRAHGLHQGEFDLLATLARSGPPYALCPQQLICALLLSSGAMTHRLDRLEAAGFVERSPNPNDRRGVIVSLTDLGQHTLQQVMADYLAELNHTLAPLNPAERRQLASLLKRLLIEHDQQAPGGLSF